MHSNVSVETLTELVAAVFAGRRMSKADATIMAGVVVAAERDGTRSHGLQRMRGYVQTIDSGWVDVRAQPVIGRSATTMLSVDAANGFAQIALARVRTELIETARQHGSATLSIHNSHHFAALWPDIEPFAADGLIALSMVNTRPWMTVWDGKRRVLGTNPMAFACPRAGGDPIVWDQASSLMSQGDVLLHANAGRPLPAGIGVNADGQPTTDATAVLDDGAFLPFAGAKGSAIAFMVEVLVAAFGGGRFGFEDESASVPGAVTSNAGQFVLLLDPCVSGNFPARLDGLLAAMQAAGVERLPGDRRYANRRAAERDGIVVANSVLEELRGYVRAPLSSAG